MYPVAALVLTLLAILCAAPVGAENYASDPKWTASNNRPDPAKCVTVQQDFGYDASKQAIGGLVSRSISGAHYGRAIGTLGLNQNLSARGTFTLSNLNGGIVYLGWYNADAGSMRIANFVGLRLLAQGSSETYGDLWIFTGTYRGAGTRLALPISLGTAHSFQLDYVHTSNFGRGAMRLMVDGTTIFLDLPDGFRTDGASLNRFGMFNAPWSPSATLTAYFDDLQFTGLAGVESFSSNPGWDTRGNRALFSDCRTQLNQDFGYSASNRAGLAKGEIGGLFFRNDPGRKDYYGDALEVPLTFETAFEFSGSVAMNFGFVDSGAFIGAFNPATAGEEVPKGFIGALIEGPTAEGWYFRPIYVDKNGAWNYWEIENVSIRTGPVIVPNRVKHAFKVAYDPSALTLTLTFDGIDRVYAMDPAHKAAGGTMTHFGILPYRRWGGGPMELYFDDIDRPQ